MIEALPPLVVAGPLAAAGLLLATGKLLPTRAPDIAAILAALAVAGACAAMAAHSLDAPLVYWFGGWTPRDGRAVGIAFAVDPAGSAIGCFVGVLFAAALVFAWGYYDEVHAHFHVLMLLFMAGMVGFCLTHDLFNLFVWFEVMSVAAFALTGYALRSSALEGALNFTVVNTVGSYLILSGIGLAYARLGALDFATLAAGVAEMPSDPVVGGAFALLAAGLLIKAAQVPFQFWLGDAHAVAPSPVSVIFSGAMVALGLFGVARLLWDVFAASAPILHVARLLFLAMGATSAVLGGVMALKQRHIKRLLAFSTISHAGIMLVGLATLDGRGLSGVLLYLVGHGLTKAALFMVAGILLAQCGGIDEIGLRGMGRAAWPAGVAMGLGGLLLAGLPLGLMDAGHALIEASARSTSVSFALAATVAGAACTGAAVLRVTGRVFLGLGPVTGEEERAPSEEEQEKADRPLWLMMIPTATLLALALSAAGAAGAYAERAAWRMIHPDAAWVLGIGPALPAPTAPAAVEGAGWLAWLSVGLAVAIAAFELTRRRLPRRAVGLVDRVVNPVLGLLETVHSGKVTDYVAWIVVGLALFTLAFVRA